MLQMLDLEYSEHNVDEDFDDMCEDLALQFGKPIQTVPQIIVNGRYVGGYTDLEAMQKSGKLKELLNR